jgi:predicted MPP superfamily phosphohydrolase
VELTLAGHTHGSRLTLFGRLLYPESGRYYAGLYTTPEGRLYVTRGAGFSTESPPGVPLAVTRSMAVPGVMRLGVPCEVTLLTLVRV